MGLVRVVWCYLSAGSVLAACAHGDGSNRGNPAAAESLSHASAEASAIPVPSTDRADRAGEPTAPDADGSTLSRADASAVAALAGAEVGRDAGVAPADMLLVPGGSFTMGADSGGQEDEHPAHTVTLAPFFLDRTEVTNAHWDECVAAQGVPPEVASRFAQASGLQRTRPARERHLVGRRARLLRVARQAAAARGRVREGGARHRRPPLRLGQRPAHAREDRLLVGAHRGRRHAPGEAEARTATTTSPATCGSGWRTSTIRTRTAARRAGEGKPGSMRGHHGRARRAAARSQARIHRDEPDPRRVRALDPGRRVQLRPARAARDQPRAPSRAATASRCWALRCAKDGAP